jgi:Gpi18-like mannosyltransferase
LKTWTSSSEWLGGRQREASSRSRELVSKFQTNSWLAPELLPVLLLPITGIAAALALLPIGVSTTTGDMATYFRPWMDVVYHRGLASLSGEFADYTPPYIYLMYLASWLVPSIGPVAAIKLINVPFIAILSLAVYQIVLLSSGNPSRAAIAAAVLAVAPTPLVNAFAIGQSDCIYSSFLMLFVLFAMRGAPVAAVSMFGVSLAFKLQAMFLSPVLLYLILAKRMRVWHLVLVPIIYLLMMVPAAIAGRSWFELVTIYVGQGQAFSELAKGAPNPWKIMTFLGLVNYRTGLFIGFAMAGLMATGIVLGTLRLESSSRTILLIAAWCAALMPYLLPKMHDRYFFVADIMTLALAFATPRLWGTGVLFQAGSLLAYLLNLNVSGHAAAYGVVPITLGVGLLALEYARLQVGSNVSTRDIFVRIFPH